MTTGAGSPAESICEPHRAASSPGTGGPNQVLVDTVGWMRPAGSSTWVVVGGDTQVSPLPRVAGVDLDVEIGVRVASATSRPALVP